MPQLNLEILTPENKKKLAKKPNSSGRHANPFVGISWEDANILMGLPEHPQTKLPAPLYPAQNEYHYKIEEARLMGIHKYHLRKSRQSGWSETTLRKIAYGSGSVYSGWQVKLMAGTRVATTKKLMERLKQLFKNTPDIVENNDDSLYLELKDGTIYEGLPANPEAATGDTKIKAFVLDESAKWELIDDRPVLNSIMPIVRTNRADLYALSTTKGPRGFFYDIDMTHDTTEWLFFDYDIWRTEDYLYTRAEILKMLADKSIDTDQEYLGKYTSGRNNIFSVFKETSFEAETY